MIYFTAAAFHLAFVAPATKLRKKLFNYKVTSEVKVD